VLNKGSMLVESLPGAVVEPLVVVCQGKRVLPGAPSLVRVDARYGLVRVYKGAATVEDKEARTQVSAGMEISLEAGAAPAKASQRKDELEKYCQQRTDWLSGLNVDGAKWVRKTRTLWDRGAWLWVEKHGEYTYLPASGPVAGLWGAKFWSPATVYEAGAAGMTRSRTR